jgi:4-hydroxy-tetrahydrodipicolinate synthase
MEFQWKGVMPALTTKFDGEDRLDLALFEKNVQAQLEAGVSGIILGGTLGEASTLEPGEREALTRKAVELTGGSVPVIVNIAEGSTQRAIRAVEAAESCGAHGLMVLPPMRYKPTGLETETYFREIARSTGLPIMVYNNPVDYGTEVTLGMFESLMKDCPNIQAVKESTRDVSNVTRIKNQFGDRLKILCGVDTLALESLAMGADGWVAGLVCAFPRETVAIYALATSGDLAAALEIYRWFLPLLELDINPQLVQNIKLAESMVGLGSEQVRKPRLPLSGAERLRVIQVIEEALKARPVLPEYSALL